MASTMQAWRTEVQVAKAAFYEKVNTILELALDWLNESDIDKSTANQVDYYLSEDLFLRVTADGISYCRGKNVLSYNTSFSSVNNITVFKLNKCVALCTVSGNGYSALNYSYAPYVIIDSINEDGGYAVIDSFANGSTFRMINTVSSGVKTCYLPYNSSSYSVDSNVMQVAPLVSSVDGAAFDNLYGVLLSPILTAAFVDFNGQKWLNSPKIALPAGDSEPTYTYV